MNLRPIALLSILSILTLASAALGAESPADDRATSVFVWFFLMPLLVLILSFAVILTLKSGAMKQGGYLVKLSDHMNRDAEHMASMERKADHMIELLASIDRRLGERA